MMVAVAVVVALDDGRDKYNPNTAYTIENINLLGGDCFEEAKSSEEFSQADDLPDGSYSDVVSFNLKPGSFCHFSSFSPFLVNGDSAAQIYYFMYKGFAPAIFTKKEECTFIDTNDLNKGKLGTWFRPNPFGGYCGFLIMMGVDEDYNGEAQVTVIR